MRYQGVCVESLAYTLPDEIVTSDELEDRMAPLYDRLRLPPGRLELITGIRERRFWSPGTLPSEKSIETGEKAIQTAGVDRSRIGALIHASVCRDHLEPATACRVHHGLGLSADCQIYDVSNACLGMLNGIVQIANMIELGQIQAGLVVGSEGSRQLVETTIDRLNTDESLGRNEIKLAVASLTIGSASAAVLLTSSELSQTQNRLTSATAKAYTEFHRLCHSGEDEAVASGMQPLMTTDSESLMKQGIEAGADAFSSFLRESGWNKDDIKRTFCHQVGATHRKLMLSALDLDAARDFATFEFLGNTGSAALPVTMAIGVERGHVESGDQLALLGIGSGINVLMLGMQWQNTPAAQSCDSKYSPVCSAG